MHLHLPLDMPTPITVIPLWSHPHCQQRDRRTCACRSTCARQINIYYTTHRPVQFWCNQDRWNLHCVGSWCHRLEPSTSEPTFFAFKQLSIIRPGADFNHRYPPTARNVGRLGSQVTNIRYLGPSFELIMDFTILILGCFTVAQLVFRLWSQLWSQLCKVGSPKLGLFYQLGPKSTSQPRFGPTNFASQLCSPIYLPTLHRGAKHDPQLCGSWGQNWGQNWDRSWA